MSRARSFCARPPWIVTERERAAARRTGVVAARMGGGIFPDPTHSHARISEYRGGTHSQEYRQPLRRGGPEDLVQGHARRS